MSIGPAQLRSAAGQLRAKVRSPDFHLPGPRLVRSEIDETESGGWVTSALRFPGGVTFDLFLDTYALAERHHFWFGLACEKAHALDSIAAALADSDYGPPRATLTDHSAEKTNGVWHLRKPLGKRLFDQIILEHYPASSEHYLGIYSPYPVPLSPANAQGLVVECTNFLRALSVAYPLAQLGIGRDLRRRRKQPTGGKAIERAGVRLVRRRLGSLGYTIESRERLICGYDLLATHPHKLELHVEVKSTSLSTPQFILSRSEHAASLSDSAWRLALVTSALTRPVYRLLTGRLMRRQFISTPATYQCLARQHFALGLISANQPGKLAYLAEHRAHMRKSLRIQ